MGVNLKQQVTGSLNASAADMTARMGTTQSGNLLVAFVTTTDTTDVGASLSTPNNTFVKIGTGIQYAGGGLGYLVMYYAKNIVGETNPVVTYKHSGTVSAAIIVAEYNGIDTVNPLDRSSYAAQGSATAITSGATPIATNDLELVVGVGSTDFGNNTYTAQSGFSNLKTVGNVNIDGAMQDKIASVAATQTSTVTAGNASDGAGGVATFRIANEPPYTGPRMLASALGTLNASQSSNQLIRTSENNLYAVVVSANRVRVYKSIDNAKTWVRQSYGTTLLASSTLISAAIDGSDNIHIIYLTSTTVVKYVLFDTSTDTFGTIEQAVNVSATVASIAITVDSNGKPHAVATSSAATTNYSNRVRGSWKPAVSVAAVVGKNIDIQIDKNNVPIVSYVRAAAAVAVALGNKNDATSFTAQDVTTSLTVGGGTTLTIDPFNNVWVGFQGPRDGVIYLAKHVSTAAWSTWQSPVASAYKGKSLSIAADKNDIYVLYEKNLGGLAYDRYDTLNGKWLGETTIQPIITPTLGIFPTNKIYPHNPFVKWSQYFNNGDTGENNSAQDTIEYLFDNGTTIYYDRLVTTQIASSYFEIRPITPAAGGGATTISTSSTSSSISTSTSVSTSTSSTSSSTSISTSTSSTSTSRSTSTSSTSSSTSISTSISSTSQSTSISTSVSSTSQSTSTSISTSSTSSSISTSISSTSQSTSTSVSTSSTSSSTSVSTSSTSQSTSTSLSTSSTSSSTSTSTSSTSQSTSTSLSTSSTSQSTSTTVSFTTSTSSTSTSLSTSTSSTSTSQSTSTSSTSQSTSTSVSTSSTSQSTSTSFSTSSTSTSTSVSTSSTSSSTSISTSSTSSSTSTSFSTSSTSQSTSTSRSTSTSSTSQSTSTSISTSSTSTSTSVSTSSTSQSTSTSFSTSSTSQSTSTSFSTSSTSTSTSLSTSSTSSSISTSTSQSTSTSSTSTSVSVTTSTSSTSTSFSTSSTSSSTSTSISTSSTSTSFSTSSTSQSTSTSISTSSTSSSTSISTSSTSQSTSTSLSTSSTSQSTSTSVSTSSTSTSTSFSTSSTSQSTSTSLSTSSTSQSTSTTVSLTTSTSSTSTSLSTSTSTSSTSQSTSTSSTSQSTSISTSSTSSSTSISTSSTSSSTSTSRSTSTSSTSTSQSTSTSFSSTSTSISTTVSFTTSTSSTSTSVSSTSSSISTTTTLIDINMHPRVHIHEHHHRSHIRRDNPRGNVGNGIDARPGQIRRRLR